MTLKEKFGNVVLNQTHNIECEKIADDSAIGFADWTRVCKLKQRPYDFEDIKKLLEIYKEEKDL